MGLGLRLEGLGGRPLETNGTRLEALGMCRDVHQQHWIPWEKNARQGLGHSWTISGRPLAILGRSLKVKQRRWKAFGSP